MTQDTGWTITGSNSLADALRRVTRFHPTATPITIVTEGTDIPRDAIAIGPAVLSPSAGNYVPYYGAFEAIEEVRRAIDAGEVGKLYGCYASMRVSRDVGGNDVPFNALLPTLAVALDLIREPIVRVWAANRSLLAERDAWFVHLRAASDALVTVEAMATADPASSRELLVEVTGAERVLRAEPTRQAVVVDRFDAADVAYPWWEDLNERFLQLVTTRRTSDDLGSGERLRAVWNAIQESSNSGAAVLLD